VALGDGKLYIGQLDGKLVALDQKTGNIVWSTQVARWQDGYTITSAPSTTTAASTRGSQAASTRSAAGSRLFNAKTGKELWRFYTIPGPGKIGHDTWPQTGSAGRTRRAGLADTGNRFRSSACVFLNRQRLADDDGHIRPGDNLFATSIVAIDAATGKYRWHFQEVHHDIWDYDAPSPVVLFDVKVNGTLRHAIAQSGKTGWTYILDRTNGKPLYGITEKPVPQNAEQATAKTQPFPSNPSVIPQKVTEANFEAIAKAAAQNSETKGLTPVKASRIFTPVRKGTVTVVLPNPMGGTNWPPMSYNPNTQMLYVCSVAATGGLSYGATKAPAKPGFYRVRRPASGRSVERGRAFSLRSTYAVGGSSGRSAGRSCVTPAKATSRYRQPRLASARNSGEAFRHSTARPASHAVELPDRGGRQQHRDRLPAGRHRVRRLLRWRNALAGDAHGDNLWLFSLDGKLGSVQAAERSMRFITLARRFRGAQRVGVGRQAKQFSPRIARPATAP